MTAIEPIGKVERPARARLDRRRRVSVDDALMGVGLMAGPANVIMELGRPGVGYGVSESRVESGRIDKHPINRARATFTYLAVGHNRHRRTEGSLPPRREPSARAGVLDA